MEDDEVKDSIEGVEGDFTRGQTRRFDPPVSEEGSPQHETDGLDVAEADADGGHTEQGGQIAHSTVGSKPTGLGGDTDPSQSTSPRVDWRGSHLADTRPVQHESAESEHRSRSSGWSTNTEQTTPPTMPDKYELYHLNG